MNNKSRTSLQLFRDCLRLVQHISGNSPKGKKLKAIVNTEFRKSMRETDENQIEHLKSHAIRALSNYLMLESSAKDAKFQQRMTSFTENEAESLKSPKS